MLKKLHIIMTNTARSTTHNPKCGPASSPSSRITLPEQERVPRAKTHHAFPWIRPYEAETHAERDERQKQTRQGNTSLAEEFTSMNKLSLVRKLS